MIILACLSCASMTLSAQILDKRREVDTLTIADRIAVKTNAANWFITVANIGVEFDLANTNYNRWTAGLNLRGNWQTKHDIKPGTVFNIFGVRLEGRNYWRMRKEDEKYFAPHTRKIDKIFSRRRANPKHPLTTYYLGGFVSYDNVSFMLFGDKGYQGSVLMGGVSAGIVRPLYEFANKNSLDLEVGFYAGIAKIDFETYRHDRESNCYPYGSKGKKILPAVNDVSVSLVYRFGKKPVTAKYRWRYDCDMKFRQEYEDSVDARFVRMQDEENLRKTIEEYELEFRKEYTKALDTLRMQRAKDAEAEKKMQNLRDKAAKDAADKLAREKFVADSIQAEKAAADSLAREQKTADSLATLRKDSISLQQPAEQTPAQQPAEQTPAQQPAEGATEQDAVTPAAEQPAQDDDNNNEEGKEPEDEA